VLKPFLLVGAGGSGGKTLRAIRQSLELRLLQEGWKHGWPKAWQMLHIDSPPVQDGAGFSAPFLPSECYLGLTEGYKSYEEVYNKVLKPGKIPNELRDDIAKPLPHWEEVTHNALRKMNQINVHTDRGMALAGVIIGWIGTGLWILGILIFIVFVSALGMFSFL
jgi:hypothetical protein